MTTPFATDAPRETTPPKEPLPSRGSRRRRRGRHRSSKNLRRRQRRHSSSSESDSSEEEDLSPPSSRVLPVLNFATYSHHCSVQQRTSILSPRRSSRLLAKVMDFQAEATAEAEVTTSDYGSLSVTTSLATTTTTTTQNLTSSSILSDELSILSIDDILTTTDSSQPSSSSTHPPPYTTISLHQHSSIYLLIPQKTYNLRSSQNLLTITLTPLPPPELTRVQDTLQIHSPLIQLLEINHPTYDFKLTPLISMPTPEDLLATEKTHLYTYPALTHLDTLTPRNSYTTFFITSPGSYLLIPKPPPIKLRKTLKPGEELELKITNPIFISVKFPPNSTTYELTTELKIYQDNYQENTPLPDSTPAAPVIYLRPHSVSFLKPVEITVEILNYREIVSLGAELKVFQCSESSVLEIPFKIIETQEKTLIHFTVLGFSYFRLLWTCLTSTLITAKLGLSSLFTQNPGTWMKCQATMDQFNNNQFGLEISIYKSDYPEVRAYSHIVGVSTSKLVKFGKFLVNVKSELFEANLEAGEEAGLVKEEEFWGQEMNFQFSLRFKQAKSIDRGPIGKVLVKHKNSTIFEFNIQKQGNEGEQQDKSNEFLSDDGNPNSRWSTMALQELGTNLFITDSDNWKTFAKYLKFTKHEIKTKFKTQADPFRAILDCYRARGGTPEEFIKSLYEVHRSIKFSGGASGGETKSPAGSLSSRKSNKSSGFGSMEVVGIVAGPRKELDTEEGSSSSSSDDGERPERNDVTKSSPVAAGSKKTKSSIKVKKSEKPPAKKKRKKSKKKSEEDEEDEEESSDEHNSSKSSQNLRTSTTLLDSTTSLWDFSLHLNSSSWKALGRSLQLEESTLVNIEQTHRHAGNRECFYQVLLQWRESYPKQCTCGTLYSALVKEGMVAQAKKMKLYFSL